MLNIEWSKFEVSVLIESRISKVKEWIQYIILMIMISFHLLCSAKLNRKIKHLLSWIMRVSIIFKISQWINYLCYGSGISSLHNEAGDFTMHWLSVMNLIWRQFLAHIDFIVSFTVRQWEGRYWLELLLHLRMQLSCNCQPMQKAVSNI